MEKIKKEADQQTVGETIKEKAIINEIKNSPFVHIVEGDKKYIGCFRVRMETKLEYDEAKEVADFYDWQMIGLYIQAIFHEMFEENKKK